jgi:AraC-like DNA-binding protein
MREYTVAAGAVRALLDFAVAQGASVELLARRSGIDPAELADRDRRIPFAQYVALMRAGQELCGDPALALHFGESVPSSEISLGSQVGAYSNDMMEGLALINRYAPLTIDVDIAGSGDRFSFARADGEVWIVDRRAHPNDFPELTESGFARMVCSGRQFLGDKQLLKAVHFTHAEPPYRAEYDRIFRVPIVFASDKNALLADDSWMEMMPPTPSGPMLDVLKAHSEALLEKLTSAKSTRGRLEILLEPLLPTGTATMEAVAGQLGLSRASLFRKLKEEGVTFEQVLDDLRHKLALRYLNGDGLSVKEAAYRLGFSEAASFSRAFKRWTGKRPSGTSRLVSEEEAR